MPGCGFTFFDPLLAGNEAFYRELEHPNTSLAPGPEFQRPRNLPAGGNEAGMDVGCGSGYFLDQAKQAGWKLTGLELNSQAAEKARAKGHTILRTAARTQARAAFRRIGLDHSVPGSRTRSRSLALMKQAAALLDSGSYIAVAVPSIRGPGRSSRGPRPVAAASSQLVAARGSSNTWPLRRDSGWSKVRRTSCFGAGLETSWR